MRRHQRPWTGRNVVRRDRRRYDLDFKIVNPRVFPLIQLRRIIKYPYESC